MQSEKPDVYAIDFGTTNSLLAAASSTRVFPPIELDPEAADPTILRSILYFTGDGDMFFGSQALSEYVERGMDGRLLRSLKRFLPAADFRSTYVGNRRYRLEELVGAILRHMRERANEQFGCDVRRVLLGRPAKYAQNPAEDALAQDRMQDSARIAGFEHVEFCPEPTAAARDFEEELNVRRVVLVADFGGGTSDFCVVRMNSRGFSPDDVVATGGVSVAGDSLDGALMKHELSCHFGRDALYSLPLSDTRLPMPAAIMDMLCTPAKLSLLQSKEVRRLLSDVKYGCCSREDRQAVERLECVVEDVLGFQVFESVERSKIALSEELETEFRFEYPGMNIRQSITRTQFDGACGPAMRSILRALDATLDQAELKGDAVDLVCLTGGTSRVPLMADSLARRFGASRLRRLQGLHSVVGGLAHHAQLQLRSERDLPSPGGTQNS